MLALKNIIFILKSVYIVLSSSKNKLLPFECSNNLNATIIAFSIKIALNIIIFKCILFMVYV